VTAATVLHRPKHLIVLMALFALVAMALLTGCTAEVDAEMRTLAGINAIRAQGGLPPLQADAGLTNVARARSRDMAAKDYFSHQPPDGCNFVCIMDNMRLPHAWAGENIAWNNWGWSQSADQAVSMWRKSPPHMENIMSCHYQRFGAGVVKAPDGKIYYTMIFEGNANC
jgi:uncharacterized protein YkwD